MHAFGARDNVRRILQRACCNMEPENEEIRAAAVYMLGRIERFPPEVSAVVARAHGSTDKAHAVHVEVKALRGVPE